MRYIDEDDDLYWEYEKPEVAILKISLKGNRELEKEIGDFTQTFFSDFLNQEENYEELERLGYDIDNLFNVSSLITPDDITISITVPNIDTYDTGYLEELQNAFEDDFTSGEIINAVYDDYSLNYKDGGFAGELKVNGKTKEQYISNGVEIPKKDKMSELVRLSQKPFAFREKANFIKENPEILAGKVFKDGGMSGKYVDLFEFYEKQPPQLMKITEKYMQKYEDGDMDYKETAKFLREVEKVGYTFDSGLDNEPYGLRPIGVELNELQGFEEFNNGGIMENNKQDYKDGGGVGITHEEFVKIAKDKGYKNIQEASTSLGYRYNGEKWVDSRNNKRGKPKIKGNLEYAGGGGVDWYDFDKKMALINCDIIKEYAIKLDNLIEEDTFLEDWVKMKLTRVEQNMADVKKSLAGWQKFEQFNEGGRIFKKQLLHIAKYSEELISMLKSGSKLMSWQENKLAISAEYIDGIYHHLDYESGNRANKLNYMSMYNNGGEMTSENNNESLIKKLNLLKKFAPLDPVAQKKYNVLNTIFKNRMGMDFDSYLQSQNPIVEEIQEVELEPSEMSKSDIYSRIIEIEKSINNLEESTQDLSWEDMGYESSSEQIYNRIENLKQERNELKLMLEDSGDEEFKVKKSYYRKYGNENPLLVDFDINNLDEYEKRWYNDMLPKIGSKAETLQILINTVEGDYSQLSPKLANIASDQRPYEDWSDEEPIMGIARDGGRVKRKKRAKSTYNRGRAWTIDRNKFNKDEDWEIPMGSRKPKKGTGFFGF